MSKLKKKIKKVFDWFKPKREGKTKKKHKNKTIRDLDEILDLMEKEFPGRQEGEKHFLYSEVDVDEFFRGYFRSHLIRNVVNKVQVVLILLILALLLFQGWRLCLELQYPHLIPDQKNETVIKIIHGPETEHLSPEETLELMKRWEAILKVDKDIEGLAKP